MLPEKISNDLCSLLPDEDRLVLVVRLEISNEGRLQEFEFIEAVINSKKHLKHLVAESQTPGGLNEQGVKELKRSGFYKSLEKSLNSILKRLNKS